MADYRNAVLCAKGERLLEMAVAGEAQIKFTSIKTLVPDMRRVSLRILLILERLNRVAVFQLVHRIALILSLSMPLSLMLSWQRGIM